MTDQVDLSPIDAPFVSRIGRAVAFTMAVAFVLVCLFTAWAVPGVRAGVPGGWTLLDRVALVGFGALVAHFIARWGRVRATVGRDGLVVRNLFRTHVLAWPEIVSVQFGRNAPWVVLELADTEHLPVMAIQRADGEHADREAVRLATLVAERGSAKEPPR